MHKINRTFVVSLSFLFVLLTAIAAPAQTLTTLLSFDGTDGSAPWAPVVQGTDGNLYGTTEEGGSGGNCAYGCGTVFKITPTGTLTTLHDFCSQAGCVDGVGPYAGLVQGRDGNFYGTASGGGAHGAGVVFRITPSGTLTVLYSFCARTNCVDGESPMAGLVQALDGNFYGTTAYGGESNICNGYSCGTVFKITPHGVLTTLHHFDYNDGANPYGTLTQGADGSFYGTTSVGGTSYNCLGGCGTVFRITLTGELKTLHSFDFTDGYNVTAGLVEGADLNFYGTTAEGGDTNCSQYGCGTVFKITPSGTLTSLYSFEDHADGANPDGGLVQAADGNFYGTTSAGGSGTVFEITPGAVFTTIFNFYGTGADSPQAALIQGTNGTLYGTTLNGGANFDGTVFGLSVGLGPFVETEPSAGEIGEGVQVLGTDLTGATSVTFNGTAATFTVQSPSLITTTVPTGATTGTVQVITPSGTLSSNMPFRVIQ